MATTAGVIAAIRAKGEEHITTATSLDHRGQTVEDEVIGAAASNSGALMRKLQSLTDSWQAELTDVTKKLTEMGNYLKTVAGKLESGDENNAGGIS